MASVDPYTPIHLSSFEPESRYERRHWIDNFVFSAIVALMVNPTGGGGGGGQVANVNIIWKVVNNEARETSMAKALIEVNNKLPSYHTRLMRKDFVNKVQKLGKVSASMLNEFYQDLTGDQSAPNDEGERERRKRIVENLASNEEEELITDLWCMNGDPGPTVSRIFGKR